MAIPTSDLMYYKEFTMRQMMDQQAQQYIGSALGGIGTAQAQNAQAYANQEKKREEAPKPQFNEVLLILEDL